MMRKDLVLFDLDGVIIDSRDNMELSWTAVRAETGVTVPFADYFGLIGRPFREILSMLGIEDGHDAIEVVARDTPLVNPRYCHANTTVLDTSGTALPAADPAELLSVLAALAGTAPPRAPASARRALLGETIFGGRQPFDVLAAYCDVVAGRDDRRWAD